jgi:hypothetical protein
MSWTIFGFPDEVAVTDIYIAVNRDDQVGEH